jgi:hypothetical protein
MPLPVATAAAAARELWHVFLCAGPVVLRQRLLPSRHFLLQ